MSTQHEPARSWYVGTELWAMDVTPDEFHLFPLPKGFNPETVAKAWAWVENDYIKHLEAFHAPE
mgnify:CR=1 FL=1